MPYGITDAQLKEILDEAVDEFKKACDSAAGQTMQYENGCLNEVHAHYESILARDNKAIPGEKNAVEIYKCKVAAAGSPEQKKWGAAIQAVQETGARAVQNSQVSGMIETENFKDTAKVVEGERAKANSATATSNGTLKTADGSPWCE